jgi:hypothetical protein
MVTQDMKVKEVYRKYPETKKVFNYYGMLSSGCG